MNSIERLGLWDRFINMGDKYNIMNFKSIQIDFLNFNNAYKDSVLLYLSGSKLQTGVLYPSNTPQYEISTNKWIHQTGVYQTPNTPWLTVSDHKVTVKEILININ